MGADVAVGTGVVMRVAVGNGVGTGVAVGTAVGMDVVVGVGMAVVWGAAGEGTAAWFEQATSSPRSASIAPPTVQRRIPHCEP